MRRLIWFSSDVCRLYFGHSFRVQYLSLAALGLQAPRSYRQLCPGFLVHRVAPGTHHACANNNEDIGTLGRYSTEDGRGT